MKNWTVRSPEMMRFLNIRRPLALCISAPNPHSTSSLAPALALWLIQLKKLTARFSANFKRVRRFQAMRRFDSLTLFRQPSEMEMSRPSLCECPNGISFEAKTTHAAAARPALYVWMRPWAQIHLRAAHLGPVRIMSTITKFVNILVENIYWSWWKIIRIPIVAGVYAK